MIQSQKAEPRSGEGVWGAQLPTLFKSIFYTFIDFV